MGATITLDELTEIKIVDSAGDELAINADGSINVSATNLDIRDIDHTTDDIRLGDGTSLMDLQTLDSAHNDTAVVIGIAGVRQDASGSPVSADGDAHPLVFNSDGELKVAADLTSDTADDAADAGNPIKVGGKAQDLSSALSALSAGGDRFNLTGDLYRRLVTNAAYNVGWKVTTASVGTTEAQLLAVPLAGRTDVLIQNVSASNDLYVRKVTGVTTSNGIKIPKKSSMSIPLGESQTLYAIADGAATDVRLMEGA